MAAETPLRPYSVTLRSRENDQFRRVRLNAESAEHAAHLCEAREQESVDYQLAHDYLEAAREVALYVPSDSHVEGRFVRAGKTVRVRNHTADLPRVSVARREGGVLVQPRPVEAKALQASLGLHYQEKPYRVDRVGAVDERMVVASMFGLQWQDQIEGGTNAFVWASDDFGVSLHTSSYTPNVDSNDFFDDATNEVTGAGYTAGGATLGSKTSTYDTTSDQIRLDAADVSWTSSTITARHAVIRVANGGEASADPVFGFINFESDVSTTAGTFGITWDSTGIFVVDIT